MPGQQKQQQARRNTAAAPRMRPCTTTLLLLLAVGVQGAMARFALNPQQTSRVMASASRRYDYLVYQDFSSWHRSQFLRIHLVALKSLSRGTAPPSPSRASKPPSPPSLETRVPPRQQSPWGTPSEASPEFLLSSLLCTAFRK